MIPIVLPERPRILVSRTDRIGDLILSTPVFPAIKARYPGSFLAALVFKETAPLLAGNPYLDEIIVYDKRGAHKSWLRTALFGLTLRRYSFDAAIHLHPTNRANFISYFAGIPVRIGYRVKSDFLLTHTIEEKKWHGAKHEAEYNFDLLQLLDVPEPKRFQFYVSLNKDKKVPFGSVPSYELPERYAVYHPSASDGSKRWPAERFGQTADELFREEGLTPVVIGDEEGVLYAQAMIRSMKTKPMNLTGTLSLGELSHLIKSAQILISNDSGPVHIAAAVGTPVLSIFGRNLGGLGAARWRPLSERSAYLQKDVGCIECLAHNCVIGFKCLSELGVVDVLTGARKLLSVHSLSQ